EPPFDDLAGGPGGHPRGDRGRVVGQLPRKRQQCVHATTLADAYIDRCILRLPPQRRRPCRLMRGRRAAVGQCREGSGERHSTSLPSWLISSVRISASTSGSIGGICSATTPVRGDHTRLTCSAGSCSG